MEYLSNKTYLISVVLLTICVYLNSAQISNEYAFQNFCIGDCQARYARLRCLQQYPQADFVSYNNTQDTHCFLQCFLYKLGLIDLIFRGLDSKKFLDIWDNIEVAFDEDTCMDKFNFNEPLSGKCIDYYDKLMEFRANCLELFEYTFSTNSSGKSEESKHTKSIGQSATEFCDSIDGENVAAIEMSEEQDVSLLSQYKKKLQCIFQNFHYLDAYGRVDESEIILSYQEATEDSPASRHIIKVCCHRANLKFQHDYYGDLVLELQNCLRNQSPAYAKVNKRRDEISRQY